MQRDHRIMIHSVRTRSIRGKQDIMRWDGTAEKNLDMYTHPSMRIVHRRTQLHCIVWTLHSVRLCTTFLGGKVTGKLINLCANPGYFFSLWPANQPQQ